MPIIRLTDFLNYLKRKGYYSAFFHGAPNGSMGFDSFAKMAGFDDYFGLNQYPENQILMVCGEFGMNLSLNFLQRN